VRILVALDHSDRDSIALRECARIVKATNGAAMLVSVVPRPRCLMPGPMREAGAYLHAVQAGMQEQHGIQPEGVVLKGDPASEIVRTAHQFEVDMVILVTRGRRGFMLSSTAEAVLAASRAPVLLVNEATCASLRDDEADKQAAYMASVVWARTVRGVCLPEDALEEIERLARQGLNREVMTATFQSLQKKSADVDLLDLGFQVRTLRRFLPDELDALKFSSDETTSAA
jgi:nucleotide-binding universal stress UspA family protein